MECEEACVLLLALKSGLSTTAAGETKEIATVELCGAPSAPTTNTTTITETTETDDDDDQATTDDDQAMLTLEEVAGILHPQCADGAILVNPGRGKKFHQKVNQQFIEYLDQHPMFLQTFVIPNNTLKENRLKLAQASWKLLMGWVHQHHEFYILEYNGDSTFNILHKWSSSHHQESTIAHQEPHLGELVHKFVSRYSYLFSSKAIKHTSTYTLGRGRWNFTSKFQIRPLTPTDKEALATMRRGQFSIQQLCSRQKKNGTPGLKSPPGDRQTESDPEPHSQLDLAPKNLVQTKLCFGQQLPKAVSGKKKQKPSSLSKWLEYLRSNSTLPDLFLSQYTKLVEVHNRLIVDHNLYPPRVCWEDVFTAKCQEPDPPCWECRQCRIRFSQATIVVVAAQGTRDSQCLPHFGAVFRHPRYRDFSIEEWSQISVEELTMLYSPTSKQGLSAMTVHFFLNSFAHGEEFLPRNVEDLTCYKGFRKKSACLLLSAMDPSLEVGIPVDRHLATCFGTLGWADPAATDAEILSQMVELWLPKDKWAECNIVCAGLRQVWQKKSHRPTLQACALALGEDHLSLLLRCCCSVEEDEDP